jgi:hypothetical protein
VNRFALLACVGLLADCAPAPGQSDRVWVHAENSCVQLSFGGNDTGGTPTATFTATVPVSAAGGGLPLAGALAPRATAPASPGGQSCTVSAGPNNHTATGR